MKFPACAMDFSGMVWPWSLTGTTLPSGESISRICLYIPLKNVIIRTSLIAPTVEPFDPPVSIRHIRHIMTNDGHEAIVFGRATLAPVVVIADTTVKSKSIGTIFDTK